jgi:hypothetical protein
MLMPVRTGELTSLSPIAVEDAEAFRAAAEHAGARAAAYYFPRLYFYGQSEAHALRWERHAGAILTYQIRQRKVGSQVKSQMNLFLPPFPFDPAALRHAVQWMRDFNGDRSGRIIFVEEGQALRIAREGFAISVRGEEFIYDRDAVAALRGAAFKGLRQELSRALRAGVVVTRPYTRADYSTCLALTKAWRERLAARGVKPEGYTSTLACLTAADRFPPSLLQGLVAEVDSTVRGFAFGGPLTSTLGSYYLGVADPGVHGLAYLLSHRLMAGWPGLTHFNDSDDAGRPGVRAMKQQFRPVEMHAVFSAREH